jgi:hypothetical protein
VWARIGGAGGVADGVAEIDVAGGHETDDA